MLAPRRFAYTCEIFVYSSESDFSVDLVMYRESIWCLNSISSVAYVARDASVGKVEEAWQRKAHPEHTTMPNRLT